MSPTADEEIQEILSTPTSASFFLYAGAGSGKTATLIRSLAVARDALGDAFRSTSKSVAVITYTNAASNEIKERLGYDTFGTVATIHSFAWQMVHTFTKDLAGWLREDLKDRIASLQADESRGRSGTKASADRLRRIARAEARLVALPNVRHFAYSPDQTRPLRGGLSHSEVLGAFAHFLREKSVFQSIFIGKFPIVLIDEVQDTNKLVISALLHLQTLRSEQFTLGLFGDTMQRIYPDGDPNLEGSVPENWAKPEKTVNYRSGIRIVELSNKIRSAVDDRTQEPAPRAIDGVVRLFLIDDGAEDKSGIEAGVREHMRVAASDEGWAAGTGVKTLILEHAMAAKRYGFSAFLAAFSQDPALRTSMMSGQSLGTGPAVQLGQQVVPLIKALRARDNHLADRVLRKYSPLMDRTFDRDSFRLARDSGAAVREAARTLTGLVTEGDPSLRSVLQLLRESQLLVLPDVIDDLLEIENQNDLADDSLEGEQRAWSAAMDVGFEEFLRYFEYITGDSPFDTHQGVKGLEFERVMVILNDADAGGFSFSYNKLFDAAATQNRTEASDDAVSRTRRLFYVACTRARSSLAVVLYTPRIDESRISALNAGWFSAEEIVAESDL